MTMFPVFYFCNSLVFPSISIKAGFIPSNPAKGISKLAAIKYLRNLIYECLGIEIPMPYSAVCIDQMVLRAFFFRTFYLRAFRMPGSKSFELGLKCKKKFKTTSPCAYELIFEQSSA